MAVPAAVLSCGLNAGVPQWDLVINGLKYRGTPPDFTCECGGTMVLIDAGPCLTAPASITVHVGGAWVSCGQNVTPVCPAGEGVANVSAVAGRVSLPTVPACVKLDPESVRFPGSARNWRRCLGGYGTDTGDGRDGMVAVCSTCGVAGVWRVGRECGPACKGYVPSTEVVDGEAEGD